MVLLEQSIASAGGMNHPFSDRVSDVAEKTAGSVLFDVRVDGDTGIQRIAAIGYAADGTVAIVMDRDGQLTSAPIDGNGGPLVAELAAWASLPMSEQVGASYLDAAKSLVAGLRRSGRIPK
ncbi:hypothetical protein [Mesorhizobium caraganae]|uniref:hypothetical protein n=1 Tax=Mesorhizobium caraganae TaxID=483206 RepID=UPI003337340F